MFVLSLGAPDPKDYFDLLRHVRGRGPGLSVTRKARAPTIGERCAFCIPIGGADALSCTIDHGRGAQGRARLSHSCASRFDGD